MAQYRSKAREGSFTNNHLQVPDQVSKLQAEGQRQLRNLQSTQDFNAKQQQVFNDAEQRSYSSELENQRAVGRQEERNLQAEKTAAERAWAVQLENNRLRTEEANDAASRAYDFVGAVTGVTKAVSGIQKINKNLQLKAINEIRFKNQFSMEDMHAAATVNANISNAEWQRTQIVEDYLREGKSQEFINAMYEHLIKGGGYRNYVMNVGVLTEQARLDALEQQVLINDKSLSPEDLRTQLDQLRTEQRARLTVNGVVAGPQIIEKGYNATIRRMQRVAEAEINSRITAKTAEENEIEQNQIVRNQLRGGDTEGYNLEAAFSTAATSTRPGHVKEITRIIANQSTSVDEIQKLRRHKIEKDGKRISILDFDPDIGSMLDARENQLALKEEKVYKEQRAALQQEANIAQLQYLESKRQEKGFFDADDLRESIDIADELFGYGRDKKIDAELQLDTIEQEYKPILAAQVEEMIQDKTLSVGILMEMGLPSDLRNTYLKDAQTLDKMRANPEYKSARAEIEKRIEGAIAMNPEVVKYSIEGKTQSDQINWFINKYTNEYFRKYQAAVMSGNPDALQIIGDQAAVFASDYLDVTKNPKNIMNFRITAYDNQMESSKTRARELAEDIKFWKKLTPNERQYPQQWINAFGVEELQVASEELRQNGSSETFKRIGAELGISQYEAQRKLAGVAEEIDEVETPNTYQEFIDNFTPEESDMLQRAIQTNEAKLELIRSRFTNEPPPVRSSFQIGDDVGYDQVEVTGDGIAPKSHTDALIDVAATLGVNPLDLATIIGFESAGTYDPGIVGGEGGNYQGLIQFGIPERKAYGVVPGMTFEEQLRGPVLRYFQDRFKSAGWKTQGATLEDLYTTVIAGNPGANRDARDSFGTSARSGSAKMGGHRKEAMKRFGLR